MSTDYSLVSITIGASLIIVMPGPTNLLLFSAGITQGPRSSFPLIIVGGLAYIAGVAFWGFALLSVTKAFPLLLVIIKLMTALYVGFLAIKMWATSQSSGYRGGSSVGVVQIFFATFTNPKTLILASTILPAETFQAPRDFVLIMSGLLVVALPIGLAWTYLGGLLTGRQRWLPYLSIAQRSISLVLLWFSGSLLSSVYNSIAL